MTMKKFFYLLTGILIALPAWADNDLEPLLNKVTLQLQSEQWVTTKTALVNVSVNAAVSDQGIDQVQADVMQKLGQISSKGDWHIVSINRQQDSSGLENMQIAAQARLPQSELAGLRSKAKSASKPGETFTVDNIQFTPSEDEVRQANSLLRNNIYQQAKAEVDALNKVYPEQKYYLHQVDFNFSPPPIEPMPMAQNAMVLTKSVRMGPSLPLSVGNKVQLQASVVLASMPDQLAQKLTHN
jgi:hypothetical protein